METWYVEPQSRYEKHSHAMGETLFEGRTAWQDVRIARSPVYGKILFLDGDLQSAEYDERNYHEMLVHPALIALPRPPRSVLIMGGGEGATLREILRYKSIERVVMVDLDGELVKLCVEQLPEWHQGCFDDPRLELRHEDARAYVQTCGEKFDAVIHDLPQPLDESPLRMLFSRECFAAIRDVMHPDGVLELQATSAKTTVSRMHMAIRRSAAAAFSHVRSIRAFIPFFSTQWGFLVASQTVVPGALSAEEVDQRIAERIGAPLEFYNGAMHVGYYANPPSFERLYESSTALLTDDDPLDLSLVP